MHSIIVLTGSLGSGKTTVGKLLASRLSNGAHIESDVFYTFFSHPIAPHLPEADKQNKAAIAAACKAAKALYQRGYCVVLEGIFGPWALPLISAELATHTADVRYIILRTTLDEAIKRVRGRSGMSLDEVVATMHPQFEQLGEWEGNALETSCLAPTTVVDQLMDLLPKGLFRLSSSGVQHAGGA